MLIGGCVGSYPTAPMDQGLAMATPCSVSMNSSAASILRRSVQPRQVGIRTTDRFCVTNASAFSPLRILNQPDG